jgi:hypothetical protein
MAEKTYLKCSAKERKTPYGDALRVSVKVEELIRFANEHGNARGYLNLDISRRREVGQYGDTHSVVLDRWEPKARAEATTAPAHAPVMDDSDIPF